MFFLWFVVPSLLLLAVGGFIVERRPLWAAKAADAILWT